MLPPASSARPSPRSAPLLPMLPAQAVPPPAFSFHTKASLSVLVQLVSDFEPKATAPVYSPVAYALPAVSTARLIPRPVPLPLLVVVQVTLPAASSRLTNTCDA